MKKVFGRPEKDPIISPNKGISIKGGKVPNIAGRGTVVKTNTLKGNPLTGGENLVQKVMGKK